MIRVFARAMVRRIEYRIAYWMFGLVAAAVMSILSGCSATSAIGTAYSAVEASEHYKAAKQAEDNAGLLKDYNRVYILIAMYDGKDREKLRDGVWQMLQKDVQDLRSHGRHVPDLKLIESDKDLQVDGDTALITVTPHKNAGVLDTVTSVLNDHANLNVYRLSADGSRIQLTHHRVELSDKLFDTFKQKVELVHAHIITLFVEREGSGLLG